MTVMQNTSPRAERCRFVEKETPSHFLLKTIKRHLHGPFEGIINEQSTAFFTRIWNIDYPFVVHSVPP